MLHLGRPSAATIERFLAGQRRLPFSYREVGATRDGPLPSGYVVDRSAIALGAGEAVFGRAVAALRRWAMFDIGWVEVIPAGAPIEAGTVVAVLVRAGLHALNATRVVYAVDGRDGPVRRSGFAYGTLPGHAERGEERFLVEWDERTGEVRYEILAFSRPNGWLIRAGYPLARRLQRRFAADSLRAMARASSPPGAGGEVE